MMALAVAAAVASATGFALSTSLQHRAASGMAPDQIARLLRRLARKPLWLLGVLASSAAFALHAVAVHAGALVIVQPIVVSGIVFAVPVRAALDRRRTSRRVLTWVSVTAVGLTLFLVVANPSEGADTWNGSTAGWIVLSGVTVVAVVAAASARVRKPLHEGLVLSVAAGVAFGVAAGLLKMSVQVVTEGTADLLDYWPASALLVVGSVGFVLNQRSYQLAPLSTTMPLLNVVDVLVAVAFGWYVFDERPAHDPASLLVELVALALMCVGVRRCAKLEQPPAPQPGVSHVGEPHLRLAASGDLRGEDRIVIVSASVGAGHDGAARQLRTRLADLGYEVCVVDFLDLLPWSVGPLLRGVYRLQLRVAPETWQWVLAATDHRSRLSAVADKVARMAEPAAQRAVHAHAAAVVSTYPLASQTLGRLRMSGRIPGPVITYLTDMSVHPLWVAPGADAHLAVHDVPARQASRLGAADVRVAHPSVAAGFGAPSTGRQQLHARRAFGLPPVGRLALVTTGSWGVGQIEESARDVAATGCATPVIACGSNHALRARLEAAGVGIPLGWVADMPTLMHACDVVVQNAGGLTCLEALASGLPVISYRCLPGHGRANAAALEQAGWCTWAHDRSQLTQAMRAALAQPAPPLFSHPGAEDPGVLIDRLVHPSTTLASPSEALVVQT